MIVLAELQQYFSRAIAPKCQTKRLKLVKTSKEAAKGEAMVSPQQYGRRTEEKVLDGTVRVSNIL